MLFPLPSWERVPQAGEGALHARIRGLARDAIHILESVQEQH